MIMITDVRFQKGDSAFLLDDGKTAILYDSGFAFTGDQVADNIQKVLGQRSLDYVFLTHSHYDHALGSAYVCRRYPKAKVVAGAYAAKIFAKPTAKAVMRDLDGKFARTCGVTEYEDLIDDLKEDIPVTDGDVIRAGDMEFVALDMPGHTRCSIGYYCPAEKLLLCCETVGVYNGEDGVVPSYLVSYQMTLDSIDKAEKLDIETVLVPHYGVLTGEKAKFYIQKGKQSAIATAQTVVSGLKSGISKKEIAEQFVKDYYYGYTREIYPIDAMRLNTSIMIDMLEREIAGGQ